MMRLVRVLRMKPLNAVPGRDGVPPQWDRPSPPPNVHFEYKERIHPLMFGMYWFDNAMPIFMMFNSQVLEGDHGEAAKFGIGYFLLFLASGCFLAAIVCLYSYRKHFKMRTPATRQKVKRIQAMKKDLINPLKKELLLNNPLNINVWAQDYPYNNYGLNHEMPRRFVAINDQYQSIKKSNSEFLSYLKQLLNQSRTRVAARENGLVAHH